MLTILKKFNENRMRKRRFLTFYEELKKNLETYYVMDQRQFLHTTFRIDAWRELTTQDSVLVGDTFKVYERTLDAFNAAYQTWKDFETYYSADVEHKTPENARQLHALKHEADQRLKEIKPVIMAAGEVLERQLLDLKMIR